MLREYSKPLFQRQKERFPEYIAQLESLVRLPDGRQTAFLSIAAIVAHGLRNDLTIVGLVLELELLQVPDKVPYELI